MNQQRKEVRREKRIYIGVLFATVMGLLALTVYAAPCTATWAITGRWPQVTFGHAWLAAAKALLQLKDTDSHWPTFMRLDAMAHGRFWLAIALFVGIEAVLFITAVRRLDAIASRPVADRRFWQLRGVSPRTFGRTHTVAKLLVSFPVPDWVIVGRVQGRKIAVQKNNHILVIAPPRSGKSSGIIIPALLEHRGPAVSTTVKTDIYNATVKRRQQLGDCFVYNPMDPDGNTDFYDPLHACRDWDHALRVAGWFIAAVGLSGGGSQDYFNEEAESLLAPYIYAAAWHPRGSIVQVFDWLQAKDNTSPANLLTQLGEAYPDNNDIQEGAAAALAKLEGMFAYNERQLDGILGTARVFLKVYGRPRARKAASPYTNRDRNITPQALFARPENPDGTLGPEPMNTLYIIADQDDQKQLAPIIVMLISELVWYWNTQFNKGRALDVSCMFSLDETANIAPLESLSGVLSNCLPNARFLTVWHSVSQIEDKYGVEAAKSIIANSQAKIWLGSNTDGNTVAELNRLIGQPAGDSIMNPEIATAQAMQRITDKEGVLVHSHYPPTVFRQRRWFNDAYLKQLANPEPDDDEEEKLELPPPPKMIPELTGAAR